MKTEFETTDKHVVTPQCIGCGNRTGRQATLLNGDVVALCLRCQDNETQPSALDKLHAQMDGVIAALLPASKPTHYADVYEQQVENAIALSKVRTDMQIMICTLLSEAINFRKLADQREEQAENLKRLIQNEH